MTLKYIEGFETSRNDLDVRIHGLMTTVSNSMTACAPSKAAVDGYGICQLLPASSPGNNGLFFNGASTVGVWLGITTNAAWQAGGFTVGFNATSNSGNTIRPLNTVPQTEMFDGTRYWVRMLSGTTYQAATTTNFKTFIPTATQPSVGSNPMMGPVPMPGGVVGVGAQYTSATTGLIYYTSDSGTTWASQSVITSGSAATISVVPFATGNASFPHGVVASVMGGAFQVMVGTFGGTMTTVLSSTVSSTTVGTVVSVDSGFIFVSNNNDTVWSCPYGSASINQASGWTSATGFGTAGNPTGYVQGITYWAATNVWLCAKSNGVYSFANAGASGTPVQPSGAVSLVQVTTNPAYGMINTGSRIVVTDNALNLVSSSDLATWNTIKNYTIPNAAGSAGSIGFYHDSRNSRYIITESVYGTVTQSPDMNTNFQCTYISDKSPIAASGSISGISISSTTATTQPANPVAILQPYTNGQVAMGINPSAVSGGSITCYVQSATYGSTGFGQIGSVTVDATTTATHYYEMRYIKSTAATNAFTFQLYIDGVLQFTNSSAFAMSSANDTTGGMILGFSQTQNISQIDDIRVTLDDGIGISGPQGYLPIVSRYQTTDVQAQWVPTASGANPNATSVSQLTPTSNMNSFVSSVNAGDKDEYSSSSSLPAGYMVKAVKNEVYATSTGSTNATLTVGTISGSTESDSSVVTAATTGTFTSQLLNTDPNGNVAWTLAALTASKQTINHIS